MPYTDYYKSGAWNFICDVCGQRWKSTEMRKRWDGAIVCPKDFELRNPQDFVRGIRDNQSVSVARPEAPDEFIPFCTPAGSSCICGWAMTGCAVVGRPFNYLGYESPAQMYE